MDKITTNSCCNTFISVFSYMMPLVSDSSVLMGVSPAGANCSFMPSIAQVEFFFQFFSVLQECYQRHRDSSELVQLSDDKGSSLRKNA
jgi:hypothetical protein